MRTGNITATESREKAMRLKNNKTQKLRLKSLFLTAKNTIKVIVCFLNRSHQQEKSPFYHSTIAYLQIFPYLCGKINNRTMFTRTIQLLGEEGFRALQNARVILFGVGGVGGWCAEALLRTGIGHLTIVDFDKVDTTNLNRQVVAMHENIGQSKVLEMQKRLLSIAPQADIQAIERQYNAETADSFDFSQYDIVVDAIDMVECKALLLYRATQAGCKVYSSMGAGRKTAPQRIRTAEFWKVQGCPLARALRTKMKKTGLMPAAKIQCVYSEEISGDQGTLASVVGVFGMTLASMVINDLTLAQR